MASGDIVPIELGLTDGDLVTLWAPRWHEGDDEWEAFLGHGDSLYGFESVADLAAFVRADSDNDLVDHPAWPTVKALSATEFEPSEENAYDLIGVPELVAGDPDPETVAELDETLTMVRDIGEVCELAPVQKFFEANPVLGVLGSGASAFAGREGMELWDRIGTAIAQDWDGVVDAIDRVVDVPAVEAAAVAVAEAELLAAAENAVDAEDVAEDATEDAEFESVDLTEDTEDTEEEETFWTEVGIDPVKIITADGIWFTLRCYLDDEPIFLGNGDTITTFSSERALARYLADNHDHDLARVSTYAEVQAAAVDGSLEIEVTDEERLRPTRSRRRSRRGAHGGGRRTTRSRSRVVHRRSRLHRRRLGGAGAGEVHPAGLVRFLPARAGPQPDGPEPALRRRGEGVARSRARVRGAIAARMTLSRSAPRTPA